MAPPLKPPYLLASIALHAALGGCLYYFGSYQIELQRQDQQVAASAQATSQARTARRLEDLQKIKELLEQSAERQRAADADAGGNVNAPSKAETRADAAIEPVVRDPREQLAQARALSEAITDISRDIKAEKQAGLTGMSREQARAEIDAAMLAKDPPAALASTHPDEEIARLEKHARDVLAERAVELARQQEGVAVQVGTAAGQHGAGTQAPAASDGPGGQTQVTAHIADFLDSERGEGADGEEVRAIPRYRRAAGRLVKHGAGQIPQLGAGPVIKAQGRMLGAGGPYANRVYVNSWYVIGPFPGRREKGTAGDPHYPPEQVVLLDAVYRGKDNRLLKWEYHNGASYPLIPRVHADDAVYYGYTEVLLDQERDLMVWLGVDDDAQVYLNDKLIWQSDNTNKGWFFETVYRNRTAFEQDFNRTESRTVVRFKKGRNRIFFKLSNDRQEMFFSMVLTQPGS